MLREESIHQTITTEVKKRIGQLDTVLPSRYSMVFSDVATELRADLGPESFLSNEIIEDKVIGHAAQLEESATKAVSAMESKNDLLLQEVIQETIKLREELEALKGAVYEDALTGAYNRKWMQDKYLVNDGMNFKTSGIFALVDMNDFKHINDTFGHVSGDKVLVFIALQLKRSGGSVIRYGGDEFCIMFDSSMTEASAGQKMHIVRETVIKKLLKVSGHQFKTSFSYGICGFNSGDVITEVIESADSKMYDDKIQVKERLNK